MKVWIVHYDVEYEYGSVISVHSTEELAVVAAQMEMKKDRRSRWNAPYDETYDDGGGEWVFRGSVYSVVGYEVDRCSAGSI